MHTTNTKEIFITLPDERTRAVIRTRDFLLRLASVYSKDGYKKIPKEVRLEAIRLLRHYPGTWELARAARGEDDIFDEAEAERLSPVWEKLGYE